MQRSNSDELQWWQRGIIYQIYPRSFQDSSGDGIGDLNGIIQRLDYLAGTPQSLGVDAIWLSPFYPSPMKDFGYDVADYTNVHPMFGTLADFDRLVAEAHRRGLKVVIDYVPNHTSDQHPWFLESRSSRGNPRRDWYIWRDAKPDGSMPNNWGSLFGGPAWEWDEATGQYYFHHFLKEQPDLNWRNPEVLAAMRGVLRFWMERGVDGFRMDVIGMILKDPDFRDNPPNPHLAPDHPAADIFGTQENIYNQDLDEVHEIIRLIRATLDEYPDRVGIGEVWNALPRWVKYYGEAGSELQLPFNFRLIHTPWNARAVRQSVDELEAALPPFAWPNYVLGNHDVARLASRIGPKQARVAAMLLLTLRGTPTLYYGDEIGLENGVLTPEQIQDPQGKTFGLARTRDVARTPMQWDSSPYAGFSSVEPWLPVSADFRERSVAFQNDVPVSILNLYRELIDLRRRTPALTAGIYIPVDTGMQNVFVYQRDHPSGNLLVALNFGSQDRRLSLPDLASGQLKISTFLDRFGEVDLRDLLLRADEGMIISI